jgi:hypothetical protein
MIGKDGRGQAPGIRRHGPRYWGPRTATRRQSLRGGVIWLVIGALIAGSPPPARAWGRLGHRASARLAESRLSPRARAIVQDLLEPEESLADASTWADEHSRDIPGSASWHYVNVSIASAHYNPKDCKARGCVVSKIAEFREILADRHAPRARRRQALRFFVHLIQDLHQPMHVADRGDRGGNSLQLRSGRYENTNLHQVWDSGLFRARYRLRDEPELVADLKALADRPESRGWARGRIEDWADESLELGRRAYRVPGTDRTLRNGDELGRAYEQANLPAALDRLAQSGVRLASLLNEILD